MRLPKLKADLEGGEGTAEFPDGWRDESALLRADLLRDWIFDLTKEYEHAVRGIFPEAKRAARAAR